MDEIRKLSRREFLLRGLTGGAVLALGSWSSALGARSSALGAPGSALGDSRAAEGPAPRAESQAPMVVYMDPGCGCCGKWVTMMGAAGFQTSVQRTTDMAAIKKRYGIGSQLASCHTAVVGGYLVEGHVPADLIQKMLKDKPKIAGLAVPGMVNGSPGMEGPTKEPYDVVAFDAAGKTTVYARR